MVKVSHVFPYLGSFLHHRRHMKQQTVFHNFCQMTQCYVMPVLFQPESTAWHQGDQQHPVRYHHPTAGDTAYYQPRHPLVILCGWRGRGGCRALLFPCLKGLLSNRYHQHCRLNLRTLRNPKHVKHLATGIQWFIVLSRLLHICLLHSLDGNFWLRFKKWNVTQDVMEWGELRCVQERIRGQCFW